VILIKFKRKDFFQGIRFALVGFMNTAVDWIVFAILSQFNIITSVAKAISFTCGLLNSFFVNRKFTFRVKGFSKRQVIGFFAVEGVMFALHLLVITFCVATFKIDRVFCNMIATIVCLPVSFLGQKFITFKDTNNNTETK